MDDIITMEDMAQVYEVTDALEIDREAIRVDLTKADPGSVKRGFGGTFEIVLPLTSTVRGWRPILKAGLERLI